MLQLTNHTKFQTERALLLDKEGNQIWVVVIKATYQFDDQGHLELHPEQEPVCLAPLYSGKPGESSLLRDAEMVYEHPGTAVTVNGTAYAPHGRPLRWLDVQVSIGPLEKILRIFGDRRWKRGWILRWRLKPTKPAKFTSMPIQWERAFGGTCPPNKKGKHGGFEPRNPIGQGYGLKRYQLAGSLLPNIEDRKCLIKRHKQKPGPAGFGAVPPAWSPRKELAGTCDEAWMKNRMPLWPEDHDPRFHNAASPGLASQCPLKGGEKIILKNLTPSGLLTLRIPKAYLLVNTLFGEDRIQQQVQMDRVIVEPDEHKLVVVWRAALNCGIRGREVKRTSIDAKQVMRWAK